MHMVKTSWLSDTREDGSTLKPQARIVGVLEELGLAHVAGSQVGGSSGIRGVSGGERRRVTIGMELVIDPAILVLDEPTSGLDSFTALNLMGTLKEARSRSLCVPHHSCVPWFISASAARVSAVRPSLRGT